MSCQSNNGYVITGKVNVGYLEGFKVVLTTNTSSSTVIKNGSFAFRGQTDGIRKAAIMIDDEIIQFFLVNDNIDIEINDEFLRAVNVRYKKSKVVENVDKYFEENSRLFYEPFKQLYDNQQRKDSLVCAYLDFLIEKYKKSDNNEGLSMIIDDLTDLFGTKEYPEKLKELYVLMPDSEKNNVFDQNIQAYFNRFK